MTMDVELFDDMVNKLKYVKRGQMESIWDNMTGEVNRGKGLYSQR